MQIYGNSVFYACQNIGNIAKIFADFALFDIIKYKSMKHFWIL